MTYVLDTDIITALLKGNEDVKQRVQQVLIDGEEILINGISYYEIKRGFLAKDATAQLGRFDQLCREFGLMLLDSKSVFDKAAQIYASLKKCGQHQIGDADILIASSVKIRDLVLVSANVKHFSRIKGLKVQNWLN